VRGSTGFKNVSLANVLAARDSKQRVTFLRDGSDQVLFSTLISPAFEVQVGLHELLGHGSGKVWARSHPLSP
jgi:dipeptidyl-peptidase-3